MPRKRGSLAIEPNGHRSLPVWDKCAVSFLTAWLLVKVVCSVWLTGTLWGKELPFLCRFALNECHDILAFGVGPRPPV